MAWKRVDRRQGHPPVTMAFTGVADGDFAVQRDPGTSDSVSSGSVSSGSVSSGSVSSDRGDLDLRRNDVLPGQWSWLHQVHGADVVVVREPGEHAGAQADALVTDCLGAVLAVHTADCAGVLLLGEVPSSAGAESRLVVGAAHAGWRGLLGGVLQQTVETMRELGATSTQWLLGPCIGPDDYEFGNDDLALLVDRYGPSLAAVTSDGRTALDLRAGVRIALAEVSSVPLDPNRSVPNTASGDEWFSWRARKDSGRQAAAIVIGERSDTK